MKYIKKTILYVLLFHISTLNGYSLNPEKKYKYAISDFDINVSDSLYIKTADGYNIFTCYFDPKRGDINKTIIISYGDAGNLSYYFSYARQLTNYGYSVVLFDYRGFGKSDDFEINRDQLFYTEFARDLAAVINHTRLKYPKNSIGVMAFSMGTIFATLVSDIAPIDFIIAENYVTNIYTVKKRLENIARNASLFLLPTDISSQDYLVKIKKIKTPTLVFASTLDKVTTLEDSYTLLENNQCKIITYEGNHGCGLLTLSEKYYDEINQFLDKIKY
ncbi:MAG: alpha/beta fold hydrolase [Prevotella sp.]|jgi:pimeloyl-ACP methyl ester carboxylesterase|nr:alpha/beta fold hydrolase [Prevotella sp.]